MLEDLSIKDFALIDSVSLEFMPGFNILTGETGAGKSILIGALSFLLGGKGGPEVIRSGSSEARVTGTILVGTAQKEALLWLDEHGIKPENNRILLRRILRDTGRSAAWIQDVQLTRAELAEFTSFLVDIHGQHEHQSLMRVSEHRRFLDSYAGLEAEVFRFSGLYYSLVEKRRVLDEMNTSDAERSQKTEILSFAVEEIENAALTSGEEETLSSEETRLSQYEKLYGNIDSLSEILGGADGSVLGALKKARSTLEHGTGIDGNLSALLSRLENSFYELDDIAGEVRSYKDSLIFDPVRLEEIQERLAKIFRLKKKYGGNIQEILLYCEDAKRQLDQLSHWEGSRSGLERDIADLEKDVYRLGKEISVRRHAASSEMAEKVEAILKELGMAGTCFSVDLSIKEGSDELQRCGPYGFDNVEFLISANPGSPLRPLAKIASGGELSRVMLALKTVLADVDGADTLIFDEIDTGIGGEVAVAVGKHLKKLAFSKQILCITHLASIAAYAGTHIKIEKQVEAGKTTTCIYPIDGYRRIEEIARMLSGDADGEMSLQYARSLLEKYGDTV